VRAIASPLQVREQRPERFPSVTDQRDVGRQPDSGAGRVGLDLHDLGGAGLG
jgi:hypothetical protein